MDDKDKTKDQLIRELKELRGRVDELEKSDAVLREANRKIRESENRYRSLFENAADAIYLIHTETLKIFDCNPEASRIIGYTIKEIKTMTVEDLHPAEEQDVVLKIFKKISERGSLSGISGINQLRKDEKLVPVEINASTIELKGEKYSLCIIRDVTRQKQAAEARQKSEEKYRNFFNYANDSFFIIDPASRRFLDINDNAAKRLGYTKKELLNLTIDEIDMPLSSTRGNDIPRELQETESVTFEHVNRRKDGSKMPVEISSRLIEYNGRQVFQNFVRDITTRKKMEAKLRAATVTDELTDLFTRHGFFTFSERQLKLSDRTRRRISLLYMYLNNLKLINDEFGYKSGDQALVDTANILKNSFRGSDIIGRIGKDRFAVLLTDLSELNVENIIIKNVTDKIKTYNEQGLQNYNLSLNMGVVRYDPEQPCSTDKFLSRVDDLISKDKKRHKLEPLLREDKTERRIYKRFKTANSFPAELDGSDKAKIKDISIGGLCLKTSQHLAVNNIYKIKTLSADNKEISQAGVIVWSYLIGTETDKGESLPCYESGLKFIDMNDSIKSSLEKFISGLSL